MTRMTCDECGPLLSALLDGELEGGEEARLREHLGGCPACAALAEGLRGLSARLRAALPPSPSPGFYRRFFDALPAARTGAAGGRRRPLLLRTVRVPVAGVAAAVVVMGVLIVQSIAARSGRPVPPDAASGPQGKIRVIKIEPEDVVATYQNNLPGGPGGGGAERPGGGEM